MCQCIFLRNTTATDSLDHFPYDTSGFQSLNQQSYMFFLVPVSRKSLSGRNTSLRRMIVLHLANAPKDLKLKYF